MKEYGLYKNSAKEGDDNDKEEEVGFNCEDEIDISSLIIIRQQQLFLTKRMLLI